MCIRDRLKVGAISIAFLSFCQIVTGVLQGIGKIQVPVIGALLGAVVKIALNWILIRIPSINVVGAVISTDVCYLVASIFNVIMLMRYTKTRVNFSGVLIKDVYKRQRGACPKCSGTGTVRTVDRSTLVPDESLSIDEGAVRPWQTLMLSLIHI